MAHTSEICFSSIRYHGSSSSIKCHLYPHVGGGEEKTHTRGVQREPHTSHYPSNKNTNQQTTHTSSLIVVRTTKQLTETRDENLNMGQFAETHFAEFGKVSLPCPFCQINFRQSGHRNSAKWTRQLSTSAKTDFLKAKIECGAYPVYARSPSTSQRPAPVTIASRSPFPLGLCSCSTSLSKMGT